MLDREAHRHGLSYLILDQYPGTVIDPLVIARHLHRYERGPKQLWALCARYDIRLEDAHTAGADAVAAGQLAYAMCSRGRVLRRAWNHGMAVEHERLTREWELARYDALALDRLQGVWNREWRAGMSEFMLQRGDAGAAADFAGGEWPTRPNDAARQAA